MNSSRDHAGQAGQPSSSKAESTAGTSPHQELLTRVAHELNNPLTVVLGQAMILKELVSEPSVLARIEDIAEAAEQCSMVIRTALEDAQLQTVDPASVSLRHLVSVALDLSRFTLRSESIEVRTELADRLPLVPGDASQLQQLVSTLIFNACQGLRDVEGQRIVRIRTAHDGESGQISLEVGHNGPAIAKALRARIFDSFFTAGASGIGVGLALCHRIVSAHHGSIDIEERGSATPIVVRLPAAGDLGAGSGDFEPGLVTETGCTVLVVDDDESVARVVEAMLHRGGYRVEVASSGQEALRCLDTTGIDAIVCDFRMPGMNGEAFYQQIAEHHPELQDRLAFLTGDARGPEARAFLSGVDVPLLEKPVTPEAIRELVRSLTEPGCS